MNDNIQKRSHAAFDLIYLFRWNIGKEKEVNWSKVNLHEFDFQERIRSIKHKQKCKNGRKESEKIDSSNKIKIVYKEYIEPFFYYWVCIDPSFSPKDVFDEFSNGCDIGKWDFLNPFTYEPTNEICYYVRFDTKYKDKILLQKFQYRIQKGIVEICKKYGHEYVDSKVTSNNVSFYTYVPISEPPCNTSGRMKSKLTNLFNTDILEIKEEFIKLGRNVKKFPWSRSTFYALSAREKPNKISIQCTLDALQIPNELEKLEKLISQLKNEIKDAHNFDPYELTSNMVLSYKIQKMREKLNEKSLFEGNSLIFEVTHRTETTPIQWGLIKCEHEAAFNNFIRDMHQYLIEATKSSGIFRKTKNITETDMLNTLRIAASHDIGMNYDGRNKKIRQKAGNYYNDLIGKTIPDSKNDFLKLQTKILLKVYSAMDKIIKEQMT